MLIIIDYGMGNLRSVYMAFQRLGIEARVTSEAKSISQATALVLPGVGAFGDAMHNIRSLDLERPILDAIGADIPFLGICLGLQLMFNVSEEMGEHRGLGLLAGRVRRFPQGLAVPHMGWNQIHQTKPIALWRGVPNHSHAYFVHSYYVEPEDPSVIAATTDYGLDFCSVIARDNLWGIQFHPEKSQDVGERILRNFSIASGILAPDAEWEDA